MDFVLSLSLILLLNSAGRFECSNVDDETVPTTGVASSGPSTEIPSTKGAMKKREVSSGGFSSPDIEATKIGVPLAVDEKSNRTVEEEGNGRRPFIIDLGNLSSIRVRRSDSDEFTDSMIADQGGPVEEDEFADSMIADQGGPAEEGEYMKLDQDPAIQESAEDPENVREERKLESDEILEGVEQDRGGMLGGWYRRRSFAEQRYSSSEENQQRPRRHFLPAPVFPGK